MISLESTIISCLRLHVALVTTLLLSSNSPKEDKGSARGVSITLLPSRLPLDMQAYEKEIVLGRAKKGRPCAWRKIDHERDITVRLRMKRRNSKLTITINHGLLIDIIIRSLALLAIAIKEPRLAASLIVCHTWVLSLNPQETPKDLS